MGVKILLLEESSEEATETPDDERFSWDATLLFYNKKDGVEIKTELLYLTIYTLLDKFVDLLSRKIDHFKIEPIGYSVQNRCHFTATNGHVVIENMHHSITYGKKALFCDLINEIKAFIKKYNKNIHCHEDKKRLLLIAEQIRDAEEKIGPCRAL
ncbi:hypothetical protein AB1399_13310 [Hydrogenibacillus schlegelii]|uniref:hypothetical protein n=1 Tax=Hydrogenibacillus schlegelii TaxID=1484 RepID=UPI0012E3D6AD|nr:hypothetical protein [Hydrogenibacillus schlegelii]